MEVRLSQKGWVVIPAALREKYGLKARAHLQVVDYGGVLAWSRCRRSGGGRSRDAQRRRLADPGFAGRASPRAGK